MSTPRTVAAAAVLVLAALVAPTSAATAGEPPVPPDGAPITHADHVTVAADSGAEVDVLANDIDPDDPTNDDLTICRVEPSEDKMFDVSPATGFDASDFHTGGHPVMDVIPFDAAPGTYTFTYYVCDYDYLSPATLTVKVTAPQNASAEVLAARPGYVRFHNPGKRRVTIQYGSTDGRTVDDTFSLAPHSARTVRVERHAIQWTATIRTRHGETSRGSILSGIKQPVGRAPQPQSPAYPATTAPVDRTAWRLGTRQVELRSHPTRPSSTHRASASGVRVDSTDAPVTAPDTAEVSQGYFGFADVLANDSDPDGLSEDLGICRASTPAHSGLEATPVADLTIATISVKGTPPATAREGHDPVPYTLLVQADQGTPTGTYDVTYYACDHQYLTPATVTVTVTKSQVITAHKSKNRPGIVRFANPGPHGASVQIRDLDGQDLNREPPLIARFGLPANTSKGIRIDARQVYWAASSRRGPGGSGLLTGIGRPPRA